ncbi:FtsX-like permease family protein [Nonomuraea sp. NPDC048826]|uniref:FtsX-like permease family protein n=1 Tax=Nonomuraea sp. NPDC048826 TaxID=3364347 RepID=UPI00371FC504
MSITPAALRLARRNARRSPGRSALIMVMIGLPVLIVTALLTLTATMTVSARESLTADLGTADARLTVLPADTTLRQTPGGATWQSGDTPRPTPGPADVTALLGPGSRTVPYGTGTVRLGAEQLTAVETDLRDPLTRGMLPLAEGAFPGTGEIAVTPALGLRPGDHVTLTGSATPLTVSGVIEHPHRPSLRAVTGPDLPLTPFDDFWDGGAGWLADTTGPVTRDAITRLNTAGLHVTSRAAVTATPPIPMPDLQRTVGFSAAAIMVLLEIALLAGPAFAVGLQRRRHELATITAQGATPSHLRTIVLADGLLLGGTAVLLATALGIAAGGLSATVIAQRTGQIGPLDIPWASILAVAALGLAAAVTAALIPANQAARQAARHHTALILAGRTPATADRPGWPLAGALMALAGLAVAFVSRRQPNSGWLIAAALLLLVLGLLALTPWLIGLTARSAARLPLPLRLSVRDAARHRARTTSAAAAVTAVTAIAITVGIGAHSTYIDQRDAYTSARPTGTLAIWAGTISDTDWDELRATATRLLPGVPFATGYQVRGAQGHRYALRYAVRWNGKRIRRTVAVGGQDLLTLLQGRHDPQAAAALASGKAVVFDPAAVRDGKLTIRAGSVKGSPRTFHVPAVLATPADPHQGGALLPRALVEQEGFTTTARQLYAMRELPGADFHKSLHNVTSRVTIAAEPGYSHLSDPQLWAWLAGSLVIVVGGTLTATRLAANDMRPERATMLAIGAPPSILRTVVAGQALYISGLGALSGLFAGLVAGVALSRSTTTYGAGDPVTTAIPWPFVLAMVAGLPLLAAAAALITRTRPPFPPRPL